MPFTPKDIHSGDQAGGFSMKDAQATARAMVDIETAIDDLVEYTSERKIMFTDEGGYAIRLTNKTGATSVKGTLVAGHTSEDDSVMVAPIDSKAAFGVMFEDGVADGELCWIVVSGIATVLLKDGTGTTAGNWVVVSDTAGRANATAVAPPGGGLIDAAYHFGEIGHSIQTVTAGTDKTARMVIHFN
jgi:hypothetical protein